MNIQFCIRLSFFIIILVLSGVCFVSSSHADDGKGANKLQLTKSEKQWLSAQENLRFSLTNYHKPIAFKGIDEIPTGILPDYAKLIGELLDKEIELVLVDEAVSKVYGKKRSEHFLGHFAIFQSPLNDTIFLYSKPYVNTPLYVFVQESSRSQIQSIDDLEGKSIAILQGDEAMRLYVQRIKGAKSVVVSCPRKQLGLLEQGGVDAILGYKGHYSFIREYSFKNVITAYSSEKRFNVHVGVLPQYPYLHSIIDKAIGAIPNSEMRKILEKWLPESTVEDLDGLTKKERDWLEQNHKVRVRVGYWPPYMFQSPEPSGISVDYMKFVAGRYGIDIEFVINEMGWEESMMDLKTTREHYDLILAMTPSKSRHNDFALSAPYLDIPWVIFATKESDFIRAIKDLNGKNVAVERGYVMQRKLQQEYPRIMINDVANSLAALEAVATGQSDAYVGNLVNSSYLIREYGLNNLKVAAPTPFESHVLAIAVRKDWPELASIVTKAFSRMTEQQKNEIQNKWLPVRYEHGVNHWDVIWWVLATIVVAIVIIATFGLINKRLSREIEERKRTKYELDKYIHVVNENVMITTVDSSGIIQTVSDAFCATSHYSKEDLIGRNNDSLLYHEQHGDLFEDIVQKILVKGVWHGELKYRTKNDEGLWVFVTVSPVKTSAKKTRRFTCIYQNISDRKEIEILSITDKLTGLFNRHKLEEVLETELQRSSRYAKSLSIAMIDIDFFKKVNDTHGHQVGDEVLQEFSKILQKRIRDIDVVGRWGGEEFLLICPETDREGVVKLTENIRGCIMEHVFGKVGAKTASFGVTSYRSGDTFESILKRADNGLYKAKESGRNKVVFS